MIICKGKLEEPSKLRKTAFESEETKDSAVATNCYAAAI